MKFTRLFATDLLSYEMLDLPLADLGMVLVEGDNKDLGGSNGAGKSSIFEILLWTLFGVTSRGIKSDDIVREDGNHNPIFGKSRGVVEFESDGKFVQVFRHRKHKQYASKLIVVVDGVDISLGGNPETQLLVNGLLQINAEAFTSAVVFPQGNASFAGLTDASQKSILDSILGTGRFDEARERAKKKLAAVNKSMIGAEAIANSLASQITSMMTMRGQTQTSQATWETTKSQKVAELQKAVDDLVEPVLSDAAAQTNLNTLNAWLTQHATYFESINSQIAATDVQIQAEERKVGVLQGKIQLLSLKPKPIAPEEPTCERPAGTVKEYDAQLQTLRDQHTVLKTEKSNAQTKLTAKKEQIANRAITECDTCGQPLTEAAKDRMFGTMDSDLLAIESEINQKHAQIENVVVQGNSLKEIRDRAAAWETYDSALARYENDLTDWTDPESVRKTMVANQERVDAYKQQKTEHQKSLLQHQKAVAMKTQIETMLTAYNTAVATYQTARTKAEADLSAKLSESNPHDATLLQCEQRIESLHRSHKVQKSVRDRLGDEIDVLEFWIEGYGNRGLKSLLFDHAIPLLQDNANLYLDCLSGGTAHLDINTVSTNASGETRDRLNVSAKYKGGGGSYSKNSGGERRRVDLSLLFALGDLGASRARSGIQLRLLDEPFDDLDALGSEQVVDLLNTYIVPKAGTVLVMSHNDNLKSLISNRIVVVKERGISRIEK